MKIHTFPFTRYGIESSIGHTKNDCRLGHNSLGGKIGDRMNVIRSQFPTAAEPYQTAGVVIRFLCSMADALLPPVQSEFDALHPRKLSDDDLISFFMDAELVIDVDRKPLRPVLQVKKNGQKCVIISKKQSLNAFFRVGVVKTRPK